MKSLLSNHDQFIAKEDSIEVVTKLANIFKEEKLVQVEASITRFKHNEKGEGAIVLKKIIVSALEKNFESAQEKAIKKAVKLMGLGGNNE